MNNEVSIRLKSLSENIALARIAAASFAAQLDLTVTEIDEIKVAISEAVSNAIIHGYANDEEEFVELCMRLDTKKLEFIVKDTGIGIADIEKAREGSESGERMGLGFSFMESFMDEVIIESKINEGTSVRMIKYILPASVQ
jgi:stage II sporulation protein AB (anti-sigma F factor)